MGKIKTWWMRFVLKSDLATIENKHIVDGEWIIQLQLVMDIFSVMPLHYLDYLSDDLLKKTDISMTYPTAIEFIERLSDIRTELIETKYVPASEGAARIHYQTEVYNYLRGSGRGAISLREYVSQMYWHYSEIYNYLQEDNGVPYEYVERKMKFVIQETLLQLEGILDLVIGAANVKN